MDCATEGDPYRVFTLYGWTLSKSAAPDKETLPPIVRRGPGRSKVKRIPPKGVGRAIRCGRYKMLGHNARNCTNDLVENRDSEDRKKGDNKKGDNGKGVEKKRLSSAAREQQALENKKR